MYEFDVVYESRTSDIDGDSSHIGYFTRQEDAVKSVKGKSVGGEDGEVRKVSIVIYETYSEYSMSQAE